jgi:hypothetical protein
VSSRQQEYTLAEPEIPESPEIGALASNLLDGPQRSLLIALDAFAGVSKAFEVPRKLCLEYPGEMGRVRRRSGRRYNILLDVVTKDALEKYRNAWCFGKGAGQTLETELKSGHAEWTKPRALSAAWHW